MSGFIEWIEAATGTVRVEEADQAPSLERMQAFVGGNIELVNVLVDGDCAQMVVNDEGLVRDLPVNVIASKHYATYALSSMRCFPPTPICGNAILLLGVRLD